jgi:Fe-S-cluster containining protein
VALLGRELVRDDHTCKSCGRCCEQASYIEMTPADVRKWVDEAEDNPEAASALAELEAGAVEDLESTEKLEANMPEGVQITMYWDRWINLLPFNATEAVPCPFLEDDKRCRIYNVRPGVCRGYPWDRQCFKEKEDEYTA